MSSKPRFGYWNLRGLGQSIRFALEYMGVEYQEDVYKDTEEVWTQTKPTLGFENPNLPYWIDDKEKMSESKAILKYVIRKYKPELLPSDIHQMARAEQVEGIVGDADRFLGMSVYMDTEPINAMFDMMVPGKLEILSKMLGSRKFFLGDQPCFVDFIAYELFYRLKTYRTKFIEGHANLMQYVERFEQLPKIKEYIASPRYFKAPCYGPKAAKRI